MDFLRPVAMPIYWPCRYYDDDVFVLAVTAAACSMVHLVCLFVKMHLLVLLQGNCLDLVCCDFLHKLSACVRNIAVFCQHLLRPIISADLINTDISEKPKYRPIIYWSISVILKLFWVRPKSEFHDHLTTQTSNIKKCIFYVSTLLVVTASIVAELPY